MSAIFSIVAVPFGIVMRYIYNFIGSYGLSIIAFSFIAKMVTLPLTVKQKRSMIKMQALQPKMQEIQKKYGKDPQKYQEELKNLYEREGTSPMGGCGTALLTMPIMIGLYYVISTPLTYFMRITQDQIAEIAARLSYTMSGQGSQMGLAGAIYHNFDKVADVSENLMRVDFTFLGLNLAATPDFKSPSMLWLIPVISALSALLMMIISQVTNKRKQKDAKPTNEADPAAKTNIVMLLMMPVMSLYFGFILPAGLSLYWISNSVFSILQDLGINYFLSKKAEKKEIN